MASQPLACPYCNAYVTIPAGTLAGQRVPCPRCGEAFSYRLREDGASALAPPTSAAITTMPLGSTTVPTTQRRWSNRAVAGVVVGVMVTMAAVGLWWALGTVNDRRARDRPDPAGYLPADVDLVGVVYVRLTMENPAGRDFLRQLGLGPGAGGGLINLERWTSLKAEEIEQVVLGLKVKDYTFPPRLTLIVQTRESYEL